LIDLTCVNGNSAERGVRGGRQKIFRGILFSA
jgi:hypothetical protein